MLFHGCHGDAPRRQHAKDRIHKARVVLEEGMAEPALGQDQFACQRGQQQFLPAVTRPDDRPSFASAKRQIAFREHKPD
jgi:hypothetical protein